MSGHEAARAARKIPDDLTIQLGYTWKRKEHVFAEHERANIDSRTVDICPWSVKASILGVCEASQGAPPQAATVVF